MRYLRALYTELRENPIAAGLAVAALLAGALASRF